MSESTIRETTPEHVDYPATDETGQDHSSRWWVLRAFQWWSVAAFDENRPRIVDYYRHPDVGSQVVCPHCNHIMHDHGFIDESGREQVVCPGDWILMPGKPVAMKPIAFEDLFEEGWV